MTEKVYTIGYSGRKPHEISAILDALGADLFDIRFSPRSRHPYWRQENIAKSVGVARYSHCKALGNKNYKGGPVEFVNFELAVKVIRKHPRPVVLMCGCKDPAHCHRTHAAQQLAPLGFEVQEVSDIVDSGPPPEPEPPQPEQLTLF